MAGENPFKLPQVSLDPIDSDYPYGPPRMDRVVEPAPPARGWLDALVTSLVGVIAAFFSALQRPPDFVVPRTFGMSAILGIMTVLAVVFALLRWLDAYPLFYFFFSALAIGICVAQMFCGKTPRLASIAAGALILPLFLLIAAAIAGNMPDWAALLLAVLFVPLGALLGYLTGACAAGVFLIMDYLEAFWQGQSRWSPGRCRPVA
jgi:hypothetical protein